MSKKLYRQVRTYKHYFWDFYNKLDKKTKLKVDWTIDLVESIDHVPIDYFKHLTDSDGMYEIKVKVSSNIFRIFCFFDEDKLIIAINGFQKKSQKTPPKELKRAQQIKMEYFDEKNGK